MSTWYAGTYLRIERADELYYQQGPNKKPNLMSTFHVEHDTRSNNTSIIHVLLTASEVIYVLRYQLPQEKLTVYAIVCNVTFGHIAPILFLYCIIFSILRFKCSGK